MYFNKITYQKMCSKDVYYKFYIIVTVLTQIEIPKLQQITWFIGRHII